MIISQQMWVDKEINAVIEKFFGKKYEKLQLKKSSGKIQTPATERDKWCIKVYLELLIFWNMYFISYSYILNIYVSVSK